MTITCIVLSVGGLLYVFKAVKSVKMTYTEAYLQKFDPMNVHLDTPYVGLKPSACH